MAESEIQKQTYDLQVKLNSQVKDLRMTSQKIEYADKKSRFASLSKEALQELDRDEATYQAVGRAYLFTPKKEILQQLDENIKDFRKDIESEVKKQSLLAQQVKATQQEMQEILKGR